MGKEKSDMLFNKISFIYGFFFNWQMRKYKATLDVARDSLDLSPYTNVIDIGCGTGALCNVLYQEGLEAVGIDPAGKMIEIARKKTERVSREPGPQFMEGNILVGLPFKDKSFDIAVSSYVAHGLRPHERQIMYEEMKRIARHLVIYFEYNDKRSFIIDMAEWLEKGDYFNYIRTIKDELMEQFKNLEVIHTGKQSAMYICKIE
ncbi:MAG: class I SAM-dependent methyltransferase [Anaerovoracaceae bacterium]